MTSNTELTELTEGTFDTPPAAPRESEHESTYETAPQLAYRPRVVLPLNDVTDRVIGAAIAVHRELGPGLLESAYDACLAFEMIERGLTFDRQMPLPVVYRGHRLDCGYRVDFVVENSVIIEVKSVERLDRVHSAQLLSYLRLARCRVGLLLNFNVNRLADGGIKRIINGFQIT